MDGIQKSIEKTRDRLSDGQQLDHFGATLRQHQADADRRDEESKKPRKTPTKR